MLRLVDIFILIAVLLVLANTLYLTQRLRRLKRRVRWGSDSGAMDVEIGSMKDLARLDRTLWRQIESLLALYRWLDGEVALPLTRRWACSPDLLLHLVNHIRDHAPRTIIECGGGASTVVMAYALRNLGHGGMIYSIEHHARFAEELRQDLRRRGLEEFVTVILAPLTERRYDGFEHVFNWYDLQSHRLPQTADLIFVDGPYGKVNANARYPAGPELLPRLAQHGYVIIDDADRGDERKLPAQWRSLYPDLGFRSLDLEKGGLEAYFLDHKIEEFRSGDEGVQPLSPPSNGESPGKLAVQSSQESTRDPAAARA